MCRSSPQGRGNLLLRADPSASAEKGVVVFTGQGQNERPCLRWLRQAGIALFWANILCLKDGFLHWRRESAFDPSRRVRASEPRKFGGVRNAVPKTESIILNSNKYVGGIKGIRPCIGNSAVKICRFARFYSRADGSKGKINSRNPGPAAAHAAPRNILNHASKARLVHCKNETSVGYLYWRVKW